LGITQRHARLIARDQIGKLNGQVTQTTQRLAGVTEYVWVTSDDERVRGTPGGRYPKAKPSHFALDGETFRWDQPPMSGPGTQRRNPGEPIQCRCWGDPKLPDDIMADDGPSTSTHRKSKPFTEPLPVWRPRRL
jgi:SPP1 gp7 family putative phage head morphogenesis protein